MLMFANRNDASMGYFTNRVLELNRGVGDMKFVIQAMLYVPQDTLTDRRGNVGDRDMR